MVPLCRNDSRRAGRSRKLNLGGPQFECHPEFMWPSPLNPDLHRFKHTSVRTVIVETSSRCARNLIVQETGWRLLRRRHHADRRRQSGRLSRRRADRCDDQTNPWAVSQFEKAVLVAATRPTSSSLPTRQTGERTPQVGSVISKTEAQRLQHVLRSPQVGRAESCHRQFERGRRAMLAHAVGNAVTRAYLRTTMLERRRKVMAEPRHLRARATRRRSCRSRASGDAEDDQPARAA